MIDTKIMQKGETLKVCFIGYCGHGKTAYETLKTRKNVQLCGVAPGSTYEGMTESFSPDVPFYPSYPEMLDQIQPDLAIVSPVFGLTTPVIIDCAQRGIHVFAEKPIAASVEELKKVERAVKESGIRFCAMHYLRYAPAFYHAAKLVHNGAIGEVRMLTAQKSYRYGTRPWWYNDRALFGGTIPWVGIHAIDWIAHFSGKRFLSVDAQSFGNPEMAALCRFEMEDGVMSAVNLDYYRPAGAQGKADDRIRCAGTKGVLEVSGGQIILMDQTETRIIAPRDAPDLLEEFLEGRPTISPDEIFYITRVALTARDAADQHQKLKIED